MSLSVRSSQLDFESFEEDSIDEYELEENKSSMERKNTFDAHGDNKMSEEKTIQSMEMEKQMREQKKIMQERSENHRRNKEELARKLRNLEIDVANTIDEKRPKGFQAKMAKMKKFLPWGKKSTATTNLQKLFHEECKATTLTNPETDNFDKELLLDKNSDMESSVEDLNHFYKRYDSD